MNMTNFVLITVVYELTLSNTAVSGIVLSFTVPAIVFGIFAGVYVDRWNKKYVLFVTNVLRALFLLALVALHTNLFVVYLVSLLVAIVTQFFIPAESPMIPVLVKKELLLSANALFGMGIYGSLLLAYAMSGPLLLFFGKSGVFLVLTILFLIAAIFVVLIRPKREEGKVNVFHDHRNVSIQRELINLFSLIIRTKDVYGTLLLLTLAQVLVLIFAVIGPGYASSILGIRVDAFPLYFVTPAAVGMIVGAVIIGNFFSHVNKKKMAASGVILSGVGIALLPFGSPIVSKDFMVVVNSIVSPFGFSLAIIHIMLFLAFILGIANALVFVPSNTILQEKTSESLRGKIYGSLNSITGIFSLLPIAVIGGLADVYGVASVLIWLGISVLAIGIYLLFIK